MVMRDIEEFIPDIKRSLKKRKRCFLVSVFGNYLIRLDNDVFLLTEFRNSNKIIVDYEFKSFDSLVRYFQRNLVYIGGVR